ncbi:MAG: F0F1 ATP synthase subunit epsilon [Bacteroidaceae bacterium]|nr:F0F1 ATP synthase subunit epsilon [Bacteroidaceae bacterium]
MSACLMEGSIMLEIISPEKMLYNGEVTKVMLPGSSAPFTVLYNHAPLISLLRKGDVVWSAGGEETRMPIDGGFVEVKENCVTVCVE